MPPLCTILYPYYAPKYAGIMCYVLVLKTFTLITRLSHLERTAVVSPGSEFARIHSLERMVGWPGLSAP